MKKTVAILLSVLLLLNVIGFYGILNIIKYNQHVSTLIAFDEDRYSSNEEVVIAIPIAIPYMANQSGYDRVDGEFEHEGEFYRTVKQRYLNDTLFVVCVKDANAKRIHVALTDYVKTFADNPIDSKQNTKTFVSFIKDFLPSTFAIGNSSIGWDFSISQTNFLASINSRPLAVFSPPPQL